MGIQEASVGFVIERCCRAISGAIMFQTML